MTFIAKVENGKVTELNRDGSEFTSPWYEVKEIFHSIDPYTNFQVIDRIEFNDPYVEIHWTGIPMPEVYAKMRLKDKAKLTRKRMAERYFVSDGIIFEKRDKQTLETLVLKFDNDMVQSVNFKTVNNEWIELDKFQARKYLQRLTDYQQKCFNCEKELCDAIDSGKITNAVDIEKINWPNNKE